MEKPDVILAEADGVCYWWANDDLPRIHRIIQEAGDIDAAVRLLKADGYNAVKSDEALLGIPFAGNQP